MREFPSLLYLLTSAFVILHSCRRQIAVFTALYQPAEILSGRDFFGVLQPTGLMGEPCVIAAVHLPFRGGSLDAIDRRIGRTFLLKPGLQLAPLPKQRFVRRLNGDVARF